LAELRQEGLIRHLGLSGVSSAHLRENTAAAGLKLPADEVAELNTPAPDQPRRRSRKTIRRAASNRRATEPGR
jgi:aryl-alcohol dehydrogenase-like predicted oxidoreductase